MEKRLCRTGIIDKIRNAPSKIREILKTIRDYPVAAGASIGLMGYLSAYAAKMYQVAKYVSGPPAACWKGYGFQLVDFPFPKMGEYVDPLRTDILPVVPELNSLDHAVYSIFCEHPIIGIPLLIAIIAGVGYGTFKLGKWATKNIEEKYESKILVIIVRRVGL